jgi:hypothetical protein
VGRNGIGHGQIAPRSRNVSNVLTRTPSKKVKLLFINRIPENCQLAILRSLWSGWEMAHLI